LGRAGIIIRDHYKAFAWRIICHLAANFGERVESIPLRSWERNAGVRNDPSAKFPTSGQDRLEHQQSQADGERRT